VNKVSTEQTVEDLKEVLCILDERGHIKHSFENSQGEVCAVGAIHHLPSGYMGLDCQRRLAVMRAIQNEDDGSPLKVTGAVARTNDSRWFGRTRIKRRIRKAIKRLERQLEVQAMDIGKTKPAKTYEPVKSPVPERTPAPAPEPVRVPEKVPA
jgi:hypothetical protein